MTGSKFRNIPLPSRQLPYVHSCISNFRFICMCVILSFHFPNSSCIAHLQKLQNTIEKEDYLFSPARNIKVIERAFNRKTRRRKKRKIQVNSSAIFHEETYNRSRGYLRLFAVNKARVRPRLI